MSQLIEKLIIRCDGGARGNPGPAASGVVIEDADGRVLESFGRYLGTATNNQAEYQAIIFGLEEAAKYKPERVRMYLDSELAVRQLNGAYKVKEPVLRQLFHRVHQLAAKYQTSFEHVYRADNKAADHQVNLAIDAALSKDTK